MLPSRYSIIGDIGSGAFGRIRLVSDCVCGDFACLKLLADGPGARHELALMKNIKHPFIVQYRDSFNLITSKDPLSSDPPVSSLAIVLDYCHGGDLSHFLRQQRAPFPEALILDWLAQLCLALQYLHDKFIIHRDIKTENIFLDSSRKRLFLGDFGIAKRLRGPNENTATRIGTPYYLSPEVCCDLPHNRSADLWSLGCCVYELATFKHPFEGNTMERLFHAICKRPHAPIPPNHGYSADLRFLTDLLLSKKAAARPSVKEILGMKFLQPYVSKWRGFVQQWAVEQQAQAACWPGPQRPLAVALAQAQALAEAKQANGNARSGSARGHAEGAARADKDTMRGDHKDEGEGVGPCRPPLSCVCHDTRRLPPPLSSALAPPSPAAAQRPTAQIANANMNSPRYRINQARLGHRGGSPRSPGCFASPLSPIRLVSPRSPYHRPSAAVAHLDCSADSTGSEGSTDSEDASRQRCSSGQHAINKHKQRQPAKCPRVHDEAALLAIKATRAASGGIGME